MDGTSEGSVRGRLLLRPVPRPGVEAVAFDDHRACWQATLGVEVFESPVRRLAGADRMSDWRAQRSGWLELDNKAIGDVLYLCVAEDIVTETKMSIADKRNGIRPVASADGGVHEGPGLPRSGTE